MARKNIANLDLDTGEILSGVNVQLNEKKNKYFNEDHATMFQEPIRKILSLKLSKDEHKIFLLLLSEIGMGNMMILSFSAIADKLEMKKSNVTRAINGLVEKNIVIKGEKKMHHTPSLRINYGVAWKGKAEAWQKLKYTDGGLRENAKGKQIELFKPNGEAKEEWARDKNYTQFKK